MIRSDIKYRIITIFSLIILIGVQFKLIFNTFELKNKQYYQNEKKLLKEEYSTVIWNDKVYPGAQKIIDKYIYKNINQLKSAYYSESISAFHDLRDEIYDKVISELRENKTMDTIFLRMLRKYNLDVDLKYGITIKQISITFDGNHFIPLLDSKEVDTSDSFVKGVLVSGTLKDLNEQNLVSVFTVSAPLKDSYQISFAFHVDQEKRNMLIFKDMFSTFLLSLISVLLVIGIYYKTYQSWMKQKQLTAMAADFVNSISHEFNTPVATILVATHSLTNKDVMNDSIQIKSLSAIIGRQAQRLEKLIKQSLTITKLSNVNFEKQEYDLVSLLLESLADYSLNLDNQVQIIPEIEVDVANVSLNSFLFTTMLYNLLENGIKYNANIEKSILVKLTKEKDEFVLSIIDNGIGISLDKLSSIFNKFYRGKDSIQTSGLGLGLFYVQQVVKLHQWELSVESEVGMGTTFKIKIIE